MKQLLVMLFYETVQYLERYSIVTREKGFSRSFKFAMLVVEWRLSRFKTMSARRSAAGKTRGIKERRRIIRQKKDLFSWKLYYRPSLRGAWQAVACAFFHVRIYPREESSFGCSGGRGKLDVQRHRGASRNLPRTFRSTWSARERSARNISAADSSDCIFKTHNRRPDEHVLTSYSIEG